MNEKKSTYEKNYGAVIFLDALGMKGIWKNKNPIGVLDNWNSFVNIATSTFAGFDQEDKSEIKTYAFSDTAIITLTKGSIENLVMYAGMIAGIILESEMVSELYFRGCISVGGIYEHENGTIVLGPAIDESASYYSLPNMIGVFASPSAHSVLERMDETDHTKVDAIFAKYDLPFKDRIYKNAWLVKLDLELTEDMKKSASNPEFKKLQNLKEIAHYNLEHLDNVDAGEKWKNTIDFMKTHHIVRASQK